MTKDSNGKVIEPANLLMHNNENSLLFIDKSNPTKVFNFDMEHGKIVSEFDTGDKSSKIPLNGHIQMI